MVFCFLGSWKTDAADADAMCPCRKPMYRNVQKQRDETMEAVRKTLFIMYNVYNVYVDVDKCLPIHVSMNMYEYV